MTGFDFTPLLTAGVVVAGVVQAGDTVILDRCACCPVWCCYWGRVGVPLDRDTATFCDHACLVVAGVPTYQTFDSPVLDANGTYDLTYAVVAAGSPAHPEGSWGYGRVDPLPAPAGTTRSESTTAGLSCPPTAAGWLSAFATRGYSKATPGPISTSTNVTLSATAYGPPAVSADGLTLTWSDVTAEFAYSFFSAGSFPLGGGGCLDAAGNQTPRVPLPGGGTRCPPCGATMTARIGVTCGTPATAPFLSALTAGGGTEPCDGCGPAGSLAVIPNKCQFLGDRLDFSPSCPTGYGCRHRCDNTDPAVLDGHLAGNPEMVPANDCGPGVCPGYLASSFPWSA